MLDSAGSILPRFRRQLERGAALTVTDPRATRYVMTAGEAAGLVDVKVVRFSDTHTALKFVIPKARR